MARTKRTTINLDRDLLDEASGVLGTSGITDTVHAAMNDVVRRRKLEALTKLELPDLDWETIKAMRRPRTAAYLDD